MERKPYIHSNRNDAQKVRFENDFVWIDLADGRVIGMPLNWFPWLQNASEKQRACYDLHGDSVYWEAPTKALTWSPCSRRSTRNPSPCPKPLVQPVT